MTIQRFDVINHIIQTKESKEYLEIGTQNSINASAIVVESKTGVDPKPTTRKPTDFNEYYQTTSDDFYSSNKKKFDVTFIDGDHSYSQVKKDFVNAWKSTKLGGYIILHDTLPLEEEATKWPNKTKYGTYNGEVYKLLYDLKEADIDFIIVNEDQGCAVVKKTMKKISKVEEIDSAHVKFDNFISQQNDLFKIVSFEEFKDKI